MNALVVGCGSIGRRHIKNLISMPAVKHIYVFSSIKDELDILKHKKIIRSKNLKNIPADFAIIANETYKHIDTAIGLAQAGLHLFIEKPISHNLNKIAYLKKLAEKKNIKIAIGYNMRFLKAMNYIKNIFKKGTIGTPLYARIEVGQYLPSWRKNISYENCYSAFKDKGGGVEFDLSHEIDYMRYLFGEPTSWKTIKAKISSLKITSNDVFEGVYLFKNELLCNVHLDYLQPDKSRYIDIIASKGRLRCDFVKHHIKLITQKTSGKKISSKNFFNIEESYINELVHFINSIERNTKTAATLHDGIKALQLLEDSNV